MAKDSDNNQQAIWPALLTLELYKRTQGRIVRQVTGFAIAILLGLGVYRLYFSLGDWLTVVYGWFGVKQPPLIAETVWAVVLVLAALSLWIGYRVPNIPTFADFLIAVEAEMTKVTWPTQQELIRSSTVVILLIFSLAILLALYDSIWIFFFELIGVKAA